LSCLFGSEIFQPAALAVDHDARVAIDEQHEQIECLGVSCSASPSRVS
jgi:hypothetical protein